MPGMPGRSGGANKLTVEEHRYYGTLRPARHLVPAPPPPAPVSSADQRRTLRGLGPEAKRIVAALLESHGDWDAATLSTLRSYGRSCQRLAALEQAPNPDTRLLYREIRANLALLKSLNLEGTTR